MDPVLSDALTQIVIPTVATALAIALPVLLHRLLKLAEAKWSVTLDEKQRAALDALLARGVLYAESMATARAKGVAVGVSSVPVKSPAAEKALNASEFVAREARAMGLPEVEVERMRALVQAKFAAMDVAGDMVKLAP